jgi:hypothetical protein
MLTLDTTTRAEYDAAATAEARAQVVLAALGSTVTVTVYDGATVKGTGTMQSPWSTRADNVLTIGEVQSFLVTEDGTPTPTTWTASFEGSGRWMRGSFGLAASGADFTWSLATWESGQAGTLGTVTTTVVKTAVSRDLSPVFTAAASTGTIVFDWNIDDGYALSVVQGSTGTSLLSLVDSPPGITPIFSKVSGPAETSVDPLTGAVSATTNTPVGAGQAMVIEVYDGIPDLVAPVLSADPATYSVALSWTDTNTTETGYTVQRLVGSTWTTVVTLGAGSIAYTDTGRTAETAYSYRVYAINATGDGPVSNTVTVTTDAAVTGSADWAVRSTDPSVVWAHPLSQATELSKHLNPPRNADQGATNTASTPVAPRILTAQQDGQRACLDITQLGAELAAVFPAATLTEYDYPTATLTATAGATTATVELPLAASGLGIVVNKTAFVIVDDGIQTNRGIFMVTAAAVDGGTPVATSVLTFVVTTSARTPFVGSQTGLKFKYVVGGSLANPYQADLVIDEGVADLGEQTWPSPTGYTSGGAVPADAYSVNLHYEYESGGTWKYLEKVTVVAKSYNAGTGFSTLTVRRAGSDMSYNTGGDIDSSVVNRMFPCEFPVGTLIGKDITGGWARPLAPLVSGDSGITPAVADAAVTGTVTRRQMYNGSTLIANYRSGYYGHSDYWNEFQLANPFPGNTIVNNGVLPFSGGEIYLQWLMKLSPQMATRPTRTKLVFVDQYQTPQKSQIVLLSPDATHTALEWLHNYGGDNPNGNLPGFGFIPPYGEWFGMRLRLRAGHDQTYSYNSSTVTVTSASRDDTNQRMTITCGLIPLQAGCTGSDLRYFYSDQNPLQLDPQRSNYFGTSTNFVSDASSRPWSLVFKSASNGGGVLAGREFTVLSHTVSGSVTTFVVGPLTGSWPTSTPSVGDAFRLDWINMDTSAKYMDSLIQLDKKVAGDAGWVNLASLSWAITFNGGLSAVAARNCAGWNNVQPTGYANIQDGNPPGRRSVYSRFADFIASHGDIASPAL